MWALRKLHARGRLLPARRLEVDRGHERVHWCRADRLRLPELALVAHDAQRQRLDGRRPALVSVGLVRLLLIVDRAEEADQLLEGRVAVWDSPEVGLLAHQTIAT